MDLHVSGDGAPGWKDFGFSVFSKDTLVCGGAKDQSTNPAISGHLSTRHLSQSCQLYGYYKEKYRVFYNLKITISLAYTLFPSYLIC